MASTSSGVPLQAADPEFATRVRESFARQAFMRTLGAALASVAPGEVVIELPFRTEVTQQHGFLHAGAIAAVVDSACGYAALTLMPPGVGVLSIEFKINMLKPAAGERFRAIGRVVRAGNTVTVCSGEMQSIAADGASTTVALMQATMMTVRGREGISD